MAKYSMKVKGKEIGPAEVYAEPHTMTAQKVDVTAVLKEESTEECLSKMRMSVGNITRGKAPEPKTTGIKIRGVGAATKGTMARGPMG